MVCMPNNLFLLILNKKFIIGILFKKMVQPGLCNRIRNEAIKHKEIGGYAKKHSTAMVMRIIKMKCLFHSDLWM